MKRLVVLMVLIILATSMTGCRRGFRTWGLRGDRCRSAPAPVPTYSPPPAVYAPMPAYCVDPCADPCGDPCCPTGCPTYSVPSYDSYPSYSVPGSVPAYTTPSIGTEVPMTAPMIETTPMGPTTSLYPPSRAIVIDDQKVMRNQIVHEAQPLDTTIPVRLK